MRELDLPPGERRLLACLFSLTLLLRILYVFHYPADTDEPQHLHVVWGWEHGLLQYRDVFDNHMPLFHMLAMPLLRVVGERPDVVAWMRLPMMGLYLASLWATYAIGRALFSRRAGLWAALLAGLFPPFFFSSLEFRPDDLWTALWLLAIALLVAGSLTWVRSLTVGFLLGAAVGVSIKTVLMLAALAAGGAAVALLRRRRLGGDRLGDDRLGDAFGGSRGLARCAAAMLAGLAVVPLGLAAFFAVRGGLSDLAYAVFSHNVILDPAFLYRVPIRRLVLLAIVPLLLWGAPGLARRAATPVLGMRRAFVLVVAGAYFGCLYGFWPLLSRQDYLPLFPLVAVLAAPPLLALPGVLSRVRWASALRACPGAPVAVVTAAMLELAALLLAWPPWRDGAADQRALLEDVLRLTGPEDFVMDRKGETIFRPRPYRFVLETVTLERIRRRLLPDDIARALVATGTPVVLLDGHYPPGARAFVELNYLPVGRLHVAGRLLSSAEPPIFPFEVLVPGRYAIVAEREAVAGCLDGTAYTGPRFLEPGRHRFEASAEGEGLALVWASAVERGFSPFRPGS